MTETNLDQDIDRHIGQRLRARRRSLGLTQPQLAEAVGVRFQQIQKYECGEDRVSASRLWRLCEALSTTVDYFYEGLHASPCLQLRQRGGKDEGEVRKDALDLARSYRRLSDRPRRALLELAKSLSGEPQTK